MNKPILVNNNTEWLRLAPVLEKQGKFWRGGIVITSFTPFVFPCIISMQDNTITWASKLSIICETQTVDEYLSTNAKSETVDYKALYEAQTRAIKEALAEIEARAIKLAKGGTLYEEDKAKGLDEAKEILTNKLK